MVGVMVKKIAGRIMYSRTISSLNNNMRDFRGWDVSVLGEVHDISFGQLCEQFASSPQEYRELRDIYKWAARKDYIATYAERFGYSRLENYDFLFTSEPGRCRVIEIWRKEQKPRYRCHDYQNGDIFKIDEEDLCTSSTCRKRRTYAYGQGGGYA